MSHELTTVKTPDGLVAALVFPDGVTLTAKQLAHATSLMDQTAISQRIADAQGDLAWADSTPCHWCLVPPVVDTDEMGAGLCVDCATVRARRECGCVA